MGTIILIIAFVLEIAFSVYRMITKSNHQMLRSIVQIGAFGIFVLFTLLNVIEWSFRWYALGALLVIWAALGAWTLLIRGQAGKKDYRPGRVIFKAVGLLALVGIALTPALIFPQFKAIGTTGEYPVATSTFTYTDPDRVETYSDTGENRRLNVELWYPQNTEGTYPLIVFSHGSTGIKTSNQTLFRELASHGYVIASIDHTYQALFTTFPDGHTTWIDLDFLQELRIQDAKTDRQQSYSYYQQWMKLRTDDINFVIDTILAEVNKNDADPVYQRVDPEKIGVMGHSLGGSAALGIGRQRVDVNAVVALEAPFMYDIVGVAGGEFIWNEEPYPIPVLNIYSDSAWSHLGEWKEYEENYALLSDTGATAFNVYIAGVGHLDLTDLALESPFLTNMLMGHKSTTNAENCLMTINKVVLQFFDSYLKSKGSFTAAGTY
jgi:dienelactone hydrolase